MATQKMKDKTRPEKDLIAELAQVLFSMFWAGMFFMKRWLMSTDAEAPITTVFIRVKTVVGIIYYVYIFCNISRLQIMGLYNHVDL